MFNLQRLAHVFVPNLPIQVEQLTQDVAAQLIIPDVLEGNTVYAASSDLYEAGLQIGMTLQQAQQIAPTALVIKNDETTYHEYHNAIFNALKTFSPSIETVDIGQFLLNARGLERLWGDEQSLAQAICELARNVRGLEVQVGIANGKFVAEQAAWSAPPNGTCVVPAGAEARFLSPLPLTRLPYLRNEINIRLRLLGIQTLGEFAELSKSAVVLQFGPEAATLHALAQGNDRRLFQPDTPPLRILRATTLKEPLSDLQVVFNILQRLTQKLSRALQTKGYHTEALKLTVEVEGGHSQQHDIQLERGQAINPPTADDGLLGRIAQTLLTRLSVAAPITRLCLCAYPLRSWSLDAHQQTLVNVGMSERDNKLEQALELLLHRFGKNAVKIAALLESPSPVATKVILNAQGLPVIVTLAGIRQPIFGIDEHWRVERHWWSQPIRRDYYRIILADGSLRNLFRDLNNGRWYLDRSWPIH